MSCEWTCATCGETFDAREVAHAQHTCPVARASREFDKAFTKFLESSAGQFAVYYAQRIIDASDSGNLPLAKS